MLGSVSRNIILRNTSVFKRYNLPQVTITVRNIQNMTSSKNRHRTTEVDDDDESDQPIKFSTSRAASMRTNEYRDPYGDKSPSYQPTVVTISISVFLIYFCILREENDIDLMLTRDLRDLEFGKRSTEVTSK